jgi:hypothetical protein
MRMQEKENWTKRMQNKGRNKRKSLLGPLVCGYGCVIWISRSNLLMSKLFPPLGIA